MINRSYSHEPIAPKKLEKYYNKENNSSSIISDYSEIERDEYYYQWNSDGFRGTDFKEKPNIIALGCSITLGQGLPSDLIWPELLSKKLKENNIDCSIGNLGDHGASIVSSISNLFSVLYKYEYKPEYIVCNFPPMNRTYFKDVISDKIVHNIWNDFSDDYISSPPHDYIKLLPIEWINFLNLEYIKFLETFCKESNIKLIWSTWSTKLSKDDEKFLKTFKNYYPDPTRKEFPPDLEYIIHSNDKKGLDKFYKSYKSGCHKEEEKTNKEIFNYAYDCEQNMIDGDFPYARHPHPGIHRHIHWSEFYFDIITNGKK
jgi:hypothetical protein